MMRHLITLALMASVLFLAGTSAHPHMMDKECWDNKPTVVSKVKTGYFACFSPPQQFLTFSS